jgi:hypothetical protein
VAYNQNAIEDIENNDTLTGAQCLLSQDHHMGIAGPDGSVALD